MFEKKKKSLDFKNAVEKFFKKVSFHWRMPNLHNQNITWRWFNAEVFAAEPCQGGDGTLTAHYTPSKQPCSLNGEPALPALSPLATRLPVPTAPSCRHASPQYSPPGVLGSEALLAPHQQLTWSQSLQPWLSQTLWSRGSQDFQFPGFPSAHLAD